MNEGSSLVYTAHVLLRNDVMDEYGELLQGMKFETLTKYSRHHIMDFGVIPFGNLKKTF